MVGSATLSGRLHLIGLIASAAMGPRDTSDPISGAVQLPIQSVSPMSAHVADFDTSHYDNSTLSQSDFDARMCENQLHMEGHLILDTGCHAMDSENEVFAFAVTAT